MDTWRDERTKIDLNAYLIFNLISKFALKWHSTNFTNESLFICKGEFDLSYLHM